jgi:hypothetical protein
MEQKTTRTEAQQAASRANGAKSSGPATPEGKAVSSQNARKHGLYSKGHCSMYESQEDYESRLEAYREALMPANQFEEDLVRAILVAELEFDRYTADLTGLRDLATETHQVELVSKWTNFDTHCLQMASLLKMGPDALRYFEALGRAQSRARRLSAQTRKQLADAQAQRRAVEEVPAGSDAGPTRKKQELVTLNEMLLQFEPEEQSLGLSKKYLKSVLDSDHYRATGPETQFPLTSKPDKEAA